MKTLKRSVGVPRSNNTLNFGGNIYIKITTKLSFFECIKC